MPIFYAAWARCTGWLSPVAGPLMVRSRATSPRDAWRLTWYSFGVWSGLLTTVVVPALISPRFGAASAVPGRVVSRRSSGDTLMAQKLFIGGLPFGTSSEALRELFNQV